MSKAFPFCIYLSMNSWIVLSVSLSDDQACVDNYSSGKFAKNIHERLQWTRASLSCTCMSV